MAVGALWLAGERLVALGVGVASLLLLQEFELAVQRRTGTVVVFGHGLKYGPADPDQVTGLVWPMYAVAFVALGTLLDLTIGPPSAEVSYCQIGACVTGVEILVSKFGHIDLPSLWVPGWETLADWLSRWAIPSVRQRL